MKPEPRLPDTRAVSIMEGPMRKQVWWLLWLPASAWAQAAPPVVVPEHGSKPEVPLLDTVEALRPDLEPVPRTDPFAPRPNAFRKYWKNPPTPEQVALDHNGYIAYGVTKGLIAGGRWLNKVTGGPDQIQAAQAREAPLDEEQAARALRWSNGQAEDGLNDGR